MKPTIGRIVHFYDESLAGKPYKGDIRLNGSDKGPYPAMVIQTFNGDYVNLLVHAWGGDWREGSIAERVDDKQVRYWVWPPRE